MPGGEGPKLISSHERGSVDKDDVIFVLLWHLGDVLNATALFPELAAKHQRKLTFVTTRPCVPILANNPYLNKIVVLNVEIPKVLSRQDFLRSQAFANELFVSNACRYVCHFPIVLQKTERHLVEIWAQAFGIHKHFSQLKPTYFSSPNDQFNDRYDSIFVLGAGGGKNLRWSKYWHPNRWHEYVERFTATFPNIQLVQLGTYEDPLLTGVTDLRGKTSVDESYRILKHAKGCLTHDSFLAHLAAAAECPTFVIFGPTSPTHFRPLGRDIFPLGGHRYYTRCARNLCVLTLGLAPCLTFPSVEEVFQCVQRRIALSGHSLNG